MTADADAEVARLAKGHDEYNRVNRLLEAENDRLAPFEEAYRIAEGRRVDAEARLAAQAAVVAAARAWSDVHRTPQGLLRSECPADDAGLFIDAELALAAAVDAMAKEERGATSLPPFVAFGSDELAVMPEAPPEGSPVKCPHCGEPHPLNYATDANGAKTSVLGSVRCGEASYLVMVAGKIVSLPKEEAR